MKKKILAAFLVLAMSLNLAVLSGCGKKTEEVGGYVTRGEWLLMLAESLGLESSDSGTPYFKDIPAGHELFSAVQGLGDWDILTPFTGEALTADKLVTQQEVAATAAIAAGFPVGEDFDMEQAVAFAADRGIFLLDGQKYVTPSEGETALATAAEVYLNDPGEERVNIVLNPNLIDLRELSPTKMPVGDGQVLYPFGVGSVSADASGQTIASLPWGGEQIALQVGDTFIAPPTEEFPAGVAYKVTAIYDRDGVVTLDVQQPDLEDIYETLDIHTTVSADLGNIIWAEGVSATGEGGDYTISLLSSEKKSKPLYDKSFTFQKGNYQKNWTKQNSSSLGNSADANSFNESNFVYTDTPSLSDFSSGTTAWEKKLFTENKFSAGYKITGKLTIQDIAIIPDIHLFSDDASASITIKADAKASLKLEGNLNERLKIGSVPIPIPGASILGLTAMVDIYLYVDASGTIQTEAQLGYNSKVEWQQDAGLRKLQDCTMTTETGIEADIGFGGDLAATVYAFGLNVMDAGAKLGGEITAEAKVVGTSNKTSTDTATTITYKESMKVNTKLYAPIVTLYAGSENSFLKKKFGVGGEWKLLTKKNTWSKPLLDQEWVFWEKTVTLDEDGNPILNGPLDGDFSEFAGEYQISNDWPAFYEEYPNIILHEDGRITLATPAEPDRGSAYFPYETDVAPVLIEEVFPTYYEFPDGSVEEFGGHGYRSMLWGDPDYKLHHEEVTMTFGEYYIIYPNGVSWLDNDSACMEYHRGSGTADDSYARYIKVR